MLSVVNRLYFCNIDFSRCVNIFGNEIIANRSDFKIDISKLEKYLKVGKIAYVTFDYLIYGSKKNA